MFYLRLLAFIVIGGAIALMLSHARPTLSVAPAELAIDETSCGQKRSQSEVSVLIGAQFLKTALSRVARANIPYTVTGRSVRIEGQIWASGDNYLEFHNNPSVDFTASLKKLELEQLKDAPTWKILLVADVIGNARLKKMLARVGSHNTVQLKKLDVPVEALIAMQAGEKAWLLATLTIVSPDYVPVTAESAIWGIDIGVPFRVPLPSKQTVAQIRFDATSEFSLLNIPFRLSPERTAIGGNGSYCAFGRLEALGTP
jgi:hypothetical protein